MRFLRINMTTPKNKGGRPTYKPTRAIRQSVAISAGAGMNHDAIAQALGISRNTLEKYFSDELSTVAYKKRMQVIEAMFKAAINGNVSAAKAYNSMYPEQVIPKEPKAAQPGKKEQRQEDALVAEKGTEWESLLNPVH